MTHLDGISGHTKTTAIIGEPTEHSLSPAMHNLSYETLGIDAAFVAFDVDEGDYCKVVEGFKLLDRFVGTNVTMPGKLEVLDACDELTEEARYIGAVNVIEFRDKKAIGHNTDGAGFMTALRKRGVTIEGATMTMIGPGGAGSAIYIQGAFDGLAKIKLFARKGGKSYRHAEEKLPSLIERTGCDITMHALEDLDDLKACIAESDILANASNVGMGEGCTDTPVPPEFLHPGLMVADAIYYPRKTQLLKDAAAIGCKTMNGLGMLLEQAAVTEKIWFGVDMPIDLVVEKVYGEKIYED